MATAGEYDTRRIDSEESELVQRLRGLHWPMARPDVRRRCLDEILSGATLPAAAAPAPPRRLRAITGGVEHVERHELTRRAAAQRGPLSAPTRQLRLAIVL
jgi:hypothetical protein